MSDQPAIVLGLDDPSAVDPARSGTKAATLARLRRLGFPVPDGHVITAWAGGDPGLPEPVRRAVTWLAERYAGGPAAVRSSAVAEDLEEASYAGQYESVLGVAGVEALTAAVLRCRASAGRVRGGAYHARTTIHHTPAMAVLVQRQVLPDVAGVAFGADPVTGSSSTVVISAVRGSGVGLVSGGLEAEDWEVTADVAHRRGADRGTLTPDQAGAVARLLRRLEVELGHPQDVEWAIVGGGVVVLQARPMTAVPDRPTWRSPVRGAWFRGLRLGELLPEPVTPLFESWLLDRLERRFAHHQATEGGLRVPGPLHVLVNGWYFHSPIGTGRQTLLLRGLVRRPRLAVATLLASRWPHRATWLYFGPRADRWRRDALDPYRDLVAAAGDRIPAADRAELVRIVDELADAAGDFFWSLALLGGTAWRAEVALTRFCRRHLAGVIASPQTLLCGLGSATATGPAAHAVHSLDWIRETRGELTDPARPTGPGADVGGRADPRSLATARIEATAAGRRALGARRRRRFDRLLTAAQFYAGLRDNHAAWFTLAWPPLRDCVRRLGEHARAGGALDRAEDVFFLRRSEVDDVVRAGPDGRVPERLRTAVRQRRADWQRQRRLTPPLVLGRPPWLLARFLLATPRYLRPAFVEPASDPAGTLRGTPASPGTATGPVRVLRDPTAIDEVRPGEVLVVPAAAPALTVVFDRAVALCVDAGSVAAHAALIAREYGLPAVVGLGDATVRLRDGDVVTVDGGAGQVRMR
jgi:rifampicin phosphotransferase